MISSYHLDRAVSMSIITHDQASALRKLARTEQVPEDQVDLDFSVAANDEPFRLLKGFRDFFIALGILILASGFSMFAAPSIGLIFDGKYFASQKLQDNWSAILLLLFMMAVSIVISEWVTKRQRLPLASLVLTLVFAAWSAMTAATIYFIIVSNSVTDIATLRQYQEWAPLVGMLFAVFALILFYLRYRLPFVLLPLAMAGLFAAATLANYIFDFDNNDIAARLFFAGFGIVILILAMGFDLKDRFRATRLAECAFWLHLLAAPLIVHSILFDTFEGPYGAILALMLILVLSVFALIIDRRAILVSALIYLGYSLSELLGNFRIFSDYQTAAVWVVLGLFVLVLGLGWTPVRKFLVGNLISKSIRDRLPPVIV